MIPGFLAPKQRGWFKGWAYVTAASLGVYTVAALWWPWRPGRFGGLTAGTAATVIFVIDALYPLRRRLYVAPLSNAQAWLQFHLYGGVLASILVWIHMGFRWPGGWFGWTLLALTMWTTASGLLGVWLQKWIPALIVRNLRVEALYEHIEKLVEQLQERATKLVPLNASEVFERTYQTDVRPMLSKVSPSWSYLLDIGGSRDRRMEPFRHVGQFLDDDERTRLEALEAICNQKTELDAHYSLQRALRWWVTLHVPPAMLLMGLITVHIVAVVYL